MVTAYVLTFCRIAIALVFALSVIGKAQDITSFQEAILDFELLPPNWSKVVARIFLGGEVLVVLLTVLGGNALLPGFLLAVLLLLIFASSLVLALQHHRRIVCNCFGRIEQRISLYDVARNLLLTGCSLLGIWVLPGLQHSLSATDILLIGLMAACSVALVTHMADVVETLRQPFHTL